jgi:hypothetical protein
LQGWQAIDGAYGRAWRAETPGQVLEFNLEGSVIGLAYKKQKAGFGRPRVSVDGEAIETLEGFFPQDWGGGYTPVFLAKRDLPPGRHRLSIMVLDEKAEESPGHAFEIHAIDSAGLPLPGAELPGQKEAYDAYLNYSRRIASERPLN